MQIEDKEELNTFETMPKEATFYFTAIRYQNDTWFAGPSGYDKEQLIASLHHHYDGINAVRIYPVKLPSPRPLPAS